MTPDDLKNFSQRQISLAGPRYTPGDDPKAPNLSIPLILAAFDGLTYGEAYRERVRDLRDRLTEQDRKAPSVAKRTLGRRRNAPLKVCGLLDRLAGYEAGDPENDFVDLPRSVRYLLQSLGTLPDKTRRKQRDSEDESERRRHRNEFFETKQLYRAASMSGNILRGRSTARSS